MCTLTCFSTAVRLIGAALMSLREHRHSSNSEHSRSIAHELRLVPCEDYQSVGPRRVPNLGPSKQQLVRSKRDLLGHPKVSDQVERSFVGVQAVVGMFRPKRAMQCCDQLRRSERCCLRGRLLDLQVCLPYSRSDIEHSACIAAVVTLTHPSLMSRCSRSPPVHSTRVGRRRRVYDRHFLAG